VAARSFQAHTAAARKALVNPVPVLADDGMRMEGGSCIGRDCQTAVCSL